MKSKRKRAVFGTAEKPRLVIYRSLRHIQAQIVDDSQGKVLFGVSNVSKDVKAKLKKAANKTEAAALIGKALAEKAKEKKISTVVFDRNGYIYHGRVKALADGAREGGLKF